jgi:hypothetical protein
MSLAKILCLANSYKHEHRCVAGIDLQTEKWVRLVGHKVKGCLTRDEIRYPDGGEPAILDVFQVELGEPCGSTCHPEDILVGEGIWHPVRRFDEPEDAANLAKFVSREASVLNGCGDRIYARKSGGTRVDESLQLIHPEDIWWWIREESGKRRNRALFRLGHVSRVRYDLAVTDPVWLAQLQLLPPGIYAHSFLLAGKAAAKTFFTASLSEAWEGFHYKLVAGVVCLARGENEAKIKADVARAAGSR